MKIPKLEYLENKKSFLDEIKTFFIVFERLSFGENLVKKSFKLVVRRLVSYIICIQLSGKDKINEI